MLFSGLNADAPIIRGWWRVTLRGGFWDVQPWPERVEAWRSLVDNNVKLGLAAATSTAEATAGGAFQTERAVVDVHILEADPTRTVGQIGSTMDALKLGVGILEVASTQNSDPTARKAALDKAKDAADQDPLDKFVRALSLAAKIAAAIAAVYVVAQLVKAAKE